MAQRRLTVIRWVASLIEAPDGTVSSTRVLALILGIVGCKVALNDGAHWQTVSCLVGGGAVALLLRVKGGPVATRTETPTDETPDA